MFKIDWKQRMVLEFFNTKGGNFRMNYHKLLMDENGFYVERRNKKTYLTKENCSNSIDIKK